MDNVTYEAVYYVQSDAKERAVNPISIRPHIDRDMAWWDDTTPGRGTSFKITNAAVEKGTGAPRKITLITDDKKLITLIYMTLEVYNAHIRDTVVGKLRFHSNEEVQNYYLTTDFAG